MKKVQKVIYDKMFIISYFLTMLQQPNIISFAQPMAWVWRLDYLYDWPMTDGQCVIIISTILYGDIQ